MSRQREFQPGDIVRLTTDGSIGRVLGAAIVPAEQTPGLLPREVYAGRINVEFSKDYGNGEPITTVVACRPESLEHVEHAQNSDFRNVINGIVAGLNS